MFINTQRNCFHHRLRLYIEIKTSLRSLVQDGEKRNKPRWGKQDLPQNTASNSCGETRHGHPRTSSLRVFRFAFRASFLLHSHTILLSHGKVSCTSRTAWPRTAGDFWVLGDFPDWIDLASKANDSSSFSLFFKTICWLHGRYIKPLWCLPATGELSLHSNRVELSEVAEMCQLSNQSAFLCLWFFYDFLQTVS